MSDNEASVSRRRFLTAAAGTATAAAATGTASAQSTETASGGGGGGGGPPDLGGYLDDANNYGGSVTDMTGQDEVVVKVGAGEGFAFGPAGVKVDNGATVVWEWTGNGGSHNVVAENGTFKSGSPAASGPFEYTFEEDGIYNYFCTPHKGQGMLGSVVVGTDFPTKQTGGGAGPDDLPSSAKTLGVATLVVMSATLGLAYFFMRYGGDYGDFEE